MHPLNRLLGVMGVGIHRLRRPPEDFLRSYEASLRKVSEMKLPFRVLREFNCDVGSHPTSYKEYECAFAADCLSSHKPSNVLDIGSYRDFVLGVAAAYQVTGLDVRPMPKICKNETTVVDDAKRLSIATDSFDAVVSLSSIEHFGLGRYGDEFDMDGDRKALSEMIRVLKPGGCLIFTTTLTSGSPCLAFNSHRIYDVAMLREFCRQLKCEREAYFSHRLGTFCELSQVSDRLGEWDVYCGCWIKPQMPGTGKP